MRWLGSMVAALWIAGCGGSADPGANASAEAGANASANGGANGGAGAQIGANLSAGAGEGADPSATARQGAGPGAGPRACDGRDPARDAILCPSAPTSPPSLRAELLEVDSPAAAMRLLPRLRGAPDLEGLARLVILDAAAAPTTTLASPIDAVVSPIDDAVLAQVALAMELRYRHEASHADRVRALALLARVHNEALLQLGQVDAGGGALPPFARLLAGRFLHCARELIQSHTQRRVAGLEALVPTLEVRLFAVSDALAQSPYAGDDALLAIEREKARRTLLRGPVRRRIVEASGRDPAEVLRPWTDVIEQLLDQGLVDLAIERALAEAGSVGSDPALAVIVDALARRGREDGRRLALGRFAAVAAAEVSPPRIGETPAPTRSPAWIDVDGLAEAIVARLRGAAADQRRAAIARARLALQGRPDVTIAVLDRILPRGEGSTEAGASALVADLEWLLAEEDAALIPAAIRLRHQVAAARIRPPSAGEAAEAALRRRFALAAADARGAEDARIADEAMIAWTAAGSSAAPADAGEIEPPPAP